MTTLYERKILNDPEVHLSFGDPLIPIVRADDVTLELSNTDGFFDNLDLRGTLITYGRFDKFSNEELAEMTGRVTGQTIGIDRVTLTTTVHDLGDLQTLIPRQTVEAVTFPKADPQQGLGKIIPIVFGVAASTNKVSDAWELPYVGEDIASNYYDYLVGRGTFANVTVYRNTFGDTLFIVPSVEYTVDTTAYPGFTVIRFVLRQASFSGGMHRIFASADSIDQGRNFVTNAKALLDNATWGLGGSVNAASATAGAADMDAIGSMRCDGVMNVQRPAIDWLNQLLIVRGIKLDKNSAGEWTFAVDKLASTVQATFGHGKGQRWANVESFVNLHFTPVGEAVKSLVIEYRKDRWTDLYTMATTARAPLAFGKELKIQNEFIRDRTTADTVADYIAKRLTYGDAKVPFMAGQEARKLRPGDLINYESMRPLFEKTLRVIDLRRGLTKTGIDTEGWSPAIYTYTNAALPAEPPAATQTDHTRTVPSAITSLSIITSGMEPDGQGGFAAYVTLGYTVPVETWAQTIVRRRRSAAAAVTLGISTQSTTNGTSYASGAFTPASGDLLAVAVTASDTAAAGTMTDSLGGTYTKITSALKNASADKMYLFVRTTLILASASMTVTFDCTGDAATGACLDVLRIAGMSRAGANAVVQSAVVANHASGTPAPAFSASVQTGNPTIGIIGNSTSPAGLTAPTSWTERADAGYASPTTGQETVSRNSGFTGTTITWGGASASAFGAIIAEFDASLVTWETVAVDQTTGAAVLTKITGLITGLTYDYMASRVNLFNVSLSADVTLLAQSAPADTIDPAAPGTPVVTDQHLKTATFTWAAPADADVVGYFWDVRTAASGGGSVVKSGTVMGGRTVTLSLDSVAYSTARHFRVAALDYSGNGGSTGNFSASVSFSFTQVVTGDVGDTQIGTAQMILQAVTTAIRQLINTQSATESITNGTTHEFIFTVGTGAINQLTVMLQYGFEGTDIFPAWVTTSSASTIKVKVYNGSGAVASVTAWIHYW